MLSAAAELVFTEGLAAFTIDEVARRSGVAKTTIYRHFPTRNELLIAALDNAMPIPGHYDTGSLGGDLRAYLADAAPIFAADHLRAAFLEITAAGLRDPDLRRLQTTLMDGRLQTLHTMVERARGRGEIDPDLSFPDAFEAIEGPFIVRSMSRPETLLELDLDDVVAQILLQLAPAT